MSGRQKKRNGSPIVKEAEAISRKSIPAPKLYWPVYQWDWNPNSDLKEADKVEFPGSEEIARSLICVESWKKTNHPLWICREGDFWTELFDSQEVYIVDKHYSEAEYLQALRLLTERKDESVITHLSKFYVFCHSEFDKINSLRQSESEQEQRLHIDIRIVNLAYAEKPVYEIHDRFALMDGEIWHFGGTVGGVNSHLTAYSRGWPDHGDRFLAYLEKIIERQPQPRCQK